jgi:hypothetical protein
MGMKELFPMLTIRAFAVFASLAGLLACSSTANIANNDLDGGDGGRDSSTTDGSDGGGVCKGATGTCQPGKGCQVGSCPDGTPVTCLCEANGTLDACTGACPNPAVDAAAGCVGFGGVVCAPGSACQTGRCADGTPLSCVCEVGGVLDKCTGACPTNPPGVCTGYGGVACAANEGCVTGRCPDGTPVSCLCQADGTFTACTGGCPP